jgi:hypothetical protein
MTSLLTDRRTRRPDLRNLVSGRPAGVFPETFAGAGHADVFPEGKRLAGLPNPVLILVLGTRHPRQSLELSTTTTDISIPTRRTQ